VLVLSWCVAVAAVVLGSLGTVKLIDPAPTATMFEALGIPGRNLGARLLGAVEVVVGVVVLSDGPAVTVAALAAAYGLFSIGLVVLRRRSPSTPCGCVGRWSGPPSWRHVAINSALAMAALVGAVTSTTSWPVLSGAMSTTVYWLSVMIAAIAVIVALSVRVPASARNVNPRHTRRPNP
jgi:hypothetical protein